MVELHIGKSVSVLSDGQRITKGKSPQHFVFARNVEEELVKKKYQLIHNQSSMDGKEKSSYKAYQRAG